MGRKSKLTLEQWAEVDRRLMDGEGQRALAREFCISETALRQRLAKIGRSPTVQKVASMIVETEAALKSMPISAQLSAHTHPLRAGYLNGVAICLRSEQLAEVKKADACFIGMSRGSNQNGDSVRRTADEAGAK